MATFVRPLLGALAAAALCQAAGAQTNATVTITGKPLGAPDVSGFGNVPLASSPLQAAVYGAQRLDDAGIAAFDGLTRFDASLSDAYNAEGYWSFLTVRGFVLDNKYNYRRDGLPINAETFISLANKDRIEVLKGISGIQAGTSAPGGLVNLVVKRPITSLRQASLEWQQDSSLVGQVDASERFGPDDRFGLRINAEAAQLRPQTRNADGSRRALAVAADWQANADSKLEVEFETSARSQPSVPGFSLLGNRVPDAHSIDPRTNVNNQPWSLPVMLAGDTASMRWTQRLNADWQFVAHGATQRLRSDDRAAFPFGCSAENQFDRYCSDGSFDLYDFRSEGERRRIDALDLHAEGNVATGPLKHGLTVGLLSTRTQDRFGPQIYNFAGIGRIDASVATPPAPEPLSPNTNRDERNTEAYLRDVVTMADGWALWAGLRHTRIERETVLTDGSQPTSYDRAFTTPWLAVAKSLDASTLVYASWGQGIESEVVPNLPTYTNRGESLTERSRQIEAGIKYTGSSFTWTAAAFDIQHPLSQDFCDDSAPPVCTRALDGQARHRGLEASAEVRAGAWTLQGSAMHLRARRQNAGDPSANGMRPTNVPANTLKLQAAYDLGALPGLALMGGLVYEGNRAVLPDNSITIPAWTRVDLGARWRTMLVGQTQLWRVGVDNVADRRAWRESPYQFSHVYLFPLEPRTWRASLNTSF